MEPLETFNDLIYRYKSKALRKLLFYFRDKSAKVFYTHKSIAEIANESGIDKSYICRMIKTLEDEGIISITRVNLNDGYLPNFIFFDFILTQGDIMIDGEILTLQQYKKMVISNVIK